MTQLNLDTLRDACNEAIAAISEQDQPSEESAWIHLANSLAALAIPDSANEICEALQAFQRRVNALAGPHFPPRKLSFSAALVWHRERLNVSQATLAEVMEIPARTWEDWEQEQRTPPEWLQRLLLDALAKL